MSMAELPLLDRYLGTFDKVRKQVKSLRTVELTIDISHTTNEKELIESIIQQIGFPALYDSDWHGLREHFFYDPEGRMPNKLIVKGLRKMEKEMPDAYKRLMECFKIYVEDYEEFEVVIL